MRRDLIINVSGSLGITLAFMWALRLCSVELTPAALGLYLLVRRLAETASNLAQAGAPPTLRRYLAMTKDPATQLAYLKGGILTTAAMCGVVMVFAIFSPPTVAHWLLGPEARSAELLPLTGMVIVALVFHNLAASLLSALGRFGWLNVVTLLNTVAWLLLALRWNSDPSSISTLLAWPAGATMTLAGLTLLVGGQSLRRHCGTGNRTSARQAMPAYFQYGLPRIFSPLIDALLVTAGPWLLRHDLENAAHLAMALMLLRMGQILVTPAATVVGVAVARLHGARDGRRIGETLRLTTGILLICSTLSLALLWPWLESLVALWLGQTPLAAGVADCGRWLLFALVPFTMFQGLKEPIEMLSVRPLNLAAMMVGLVVLSGVILALRDPLGLVQAVTMGYVAAYFSLAAVAWFFIRPYLASVGYYGPGRLFLAALVIGGINMVGAHLATSLPLTSRILVAAACMVVSLALAVAGLWRWRPSDLMRELSAAAGRPFPP